MAAKHLLILVAAVGVASAMYVVHRRPPSRVGAGGATVTAGTTAPDFSLPTLNGDKLNLAAYRGKVVLLDFWATWCDPCREEIPHFVELQSRYGDQGLQIIGVSMDDSSEPVRDFTRQFKMNYPVVMGNAETGERYGGILGLPIAFLVDRDGRIYAKHVGATDISVFEREIVKLLQKTGTPS